MRALGGARPWVGVVAVVSLALVHAVLTVNRRRARGVLRLLRATWQLDTATLGRIEAMSVTGLARAVQAMCDSFPEPLDPAMSRVLAVDIGATRTKFMVVVAGEATVLEPLLSRDVWGKAELDKDAATKRVVDYVRRFVDPVTITRLVFSVPGTVDITAAEMDDLSVVRNMPSFSRDFQGFNFKKLFRPHFPNAKVSAVSDNMAAALGVAASNRLLQNSLVVCLGTAPAAATFFRDPDVYKEKDKNIETGIWQPWVWFTKVALSDPYGYCGGIKVQDNGHRLLLKPPDACKIPHRQARIRFALDNDTWLRLRGKHPTLPESKQAFLDDERATDVWVERVQSCIDALCQKFHSVYGPPAAVWVVGGNAVRCHGRVLQARYTVPDSTKNIENTVEVHIPSSDVEQQHITLGGLVFSTGYKVKHVFAPGQDPLSRGWTRGGEIYIWVKRPPQA